jgi:hypothetical protein
MVLSSRKLVTRRKGFLANCVGMIGLSGMLRFRHMMLVITSTERNGILEFTKAFTANRYSGLASRIFECPARVGR